MSFRPGPVAVGLMGVVLLLAGAGCATNEMKGTPFYTGEYARRNGPAEQRVNAWPIVYYRDPALSVLWPIFEFTDEHTAVRPFFSVYGLDATNRIYSVLWPLTEFDRQTGDNWIFPVFWGDDHKIVFPLYWHWDQPWGKNGGTDALFPLWILNRDGTNDFSLFCPWPLARWWSDSGLATSGSMVLPLYWHERDGDGSRFYSLLWLSGTETNGGYWRSLPPLFYQASNENFSATATLLWAQGRSGSNDWRALIPLAYWDRQQRTVISPLWARWREGDREIHLAPWLLSWWVRGTNRHDLWLIGGMAHASWGPDPGSHHVVPLYYRDAARRTFLTLLCGWQHGEGDFFYPLTPLAGVRTDDHRGSWFFPLYAHTREIKTGDVDNWYLLLGGNSREGRHRRAWFLPLFYSADDGPLDSVAEKGEFDATYGKTLWCFPFYWYQNQCHAWLDVPPGREALGSESQNFSAAGQPADMMGSRTNRVWMRESSRKQVFFPLWSYTTNATPLRNTSRVKGSVGLALYDYRHEIGPARDKKAVAVDDYTRARVLWRLWHYERHNGNVSVDMFPAITYDHRIDGFRKTSFLWRFFRYECAADGGKKLDVLFIPLRR